MRILIASACGALLSPLATTVGVILYLLAVGQEPFNLEDVGFAAAVALSAWLLCTPIGLLVGLLWSLLTQSSRKGLRQLVAFVALAFPAGAVVGLLHARGSPHVSPFHAAVANGLAWAICGLLVLTLTSRVHSPFKAGTV